MHHQSQPLRTGRGLEARGLLIARKQAGAESSTLPNADLAFHEGGYRRLLLDLEEAGAATHLPDRPAGAEALNELLIRIRLAPAFAGR